MIRYICDACLRPIDLGSDLSDLADLVLVTGFTDGKNITGRLKHVCVSCQQKVWEVLILQRKEKE